jgi:hypothetical protein
VRDLRDKITELRAAAAAVAVTAPQSQAAPIAATNVLPVASCAHQKLEFLRWQKDANGVQKQCPFIPENYENWEKMPPLCDYISIECLGKENRRAAHVFGFGGPGLMIGYADVLTWEFVFARHQNLKEVWQTCAAAAASRAAGLPACVHACVCVCVCACVRVCVRACVRACVATRCRDA